MDQSLYRTFAKNSLKGIPGYKFITRMYYFIKRPEMFDGEWECSPLKYAGQNLINSLVMVGSFAAVINWLFKGSEILELPRIINPVYLTINLALQAIIFAAIFWAIITPITALKKRGWHPLYFMQILQTYSVVNFLVVCLFWIGMQWVLTAEFQSIEVSLASLVIGGTLAITSFVATYWLLILPTVKYLSTYFSKFISWCVIVLVMSATITINQYAHLGFNDSLINKLEFCEYLFNIKSKEVPNLESMKSCIIGKCVEGVVKP